LVLLRVPHLQVFGVQTHLDRFADQSARHRVGVPLDMDRAAAIHPASELLEGLQTPRRQWPQHTQLLRQPLLPTRVELTEQAPQELLVLGTAGEVPAATQHERLVQGFLETSVPLLDVTVLVRVVRLDLLTDQPVMIHQALVTPRELLPLRQVVHRRAQPVRAMPLRHAAQFPQRILQAATQALEALRKTDRRRLPVRVGQHEVVDHVVERLPRDGYAQAAHPCEVRRRQPARLVHLGEEDLLGRPVQRPPAAHLPLQGPQLSVAEPARVAALQLLEEGLRLKARVLFQQGAYFQPDFGERIGACPPGVRRRDRTRQLLQPLVLPCRLLVHVGPHSRCRQRLAAAQQPPQLPHLRVGDHHKPPCLKGLRQSTAYSCAGFLIVAGRKVIVVGGRSNCR
jgi:hypothetical protein